MDLKNIKKPDLSKIKKPDLSKIKKPDLSNIDVPDIDDEKVFGFFKNKKVLGGLAFLLIVICSISFYFFYWLRRPEYSIDIIRKAIAMQDVQTFSRHVDLKALYGKLFDDATYGSGNDADEFSRTIAMGLNKKDKEKIVSRFENMTLSALQKKKEEREDLPSFGVIGKAVSLVCDTFEATNPAFVCNGFQVLSKKENEVIVRFSFIDIEKRKNIILDFLMKELPDKKWKIVNVMNIRKTYQSAEYIFDEEIARKLKEEAEKNAKMAAERERAFASFVVLSEEQRKKASFDIWKFFRKKVKPTEIGAETMYRFIANSYAEGQGKPSLSVYNDFTIDRDTGVVKNSAALVLSVRNNEALVDFDKIYFMSPSGGFVIDTKLWEANNLGARGILERDEWRRYTMVFLTTTDGLGDVYKLLSKGSLRILFYKGSKLLVAFDADDKLRQSISDAVFVNDLVKNKLRTESGNYVIFPMTKEMLVEIDKQIAEDEIRERIKLKDDKEKEKDSEVKAKDSKDTDEKDSNKKDTENKESEKKDADVKETPKTEAVATDKKEAPAQAGQPVKANVGTESKSKVEAEKPKQ